MKVYVLQHEHERDGIDEVKFVGVYASEDEAAAARERTRQLPGFADHSDGFAIDAYEIGQDHWPQGFITVSDTASDKHSDLPAWLPDVVDSKLKRHR